MGGYLLIAIGLINLRYQTGQSEVVAHSLTIIIPGMALLISTWIPTMHKVLNTKASQVMTAILGASLVAYAVIN